MDLDRLFQLGVRVYGTALVIAIIAVILWALDRLLLRGGDQAGLPLVLGLSVMLTAAIYLVRNVSEIGGR